MLLISGGLTNIQSVMANEIGFTYLGGASPLQATVQGADIVILATAYGLMPYGMVSGKNIHAPADLKGKIFVVARLGGIEETAARIALDRLGVGARNVSFLQAGAAPPPTAPLETRPRQTTTRPPPGRFTPTPPGLKLFPTPPPPQITHPPSTLH